MSLSLPLWAQLYLFAPFATMLVWGGLTVGLMRLNRRGPRPGRVALILALPLLLLAHHQIWLSRDDLSVWGSTQAFVAGLLIWTCHELAFYSGVLTGPWRRPCPAAARGWQRFFIALATHLYHELAVACELLLLFVMLRDAPNQIGLLVVILSWAFQHSAKLNVLLGVRYLEVALFPPHLAYLGSFWAQRASNAFLLPALLGGGVLALWFWARATELSLANGAMGAALLASLATLGLLEHVLLLVQWPLGGLQTASTPLADIAEDRRVRIGAKG